MRWEERALSYVPPPLLPQRRLEVWWWGTALGSAPEAIDTVVSREEVRLITLYYFTPRLPRGYCCVQPQQGSSAPPTVLLLVWRSSREQQRQTGLMGSNFLLQM